MFVMLPGWSLTSFVSAKLSDKEILSYTQMSRDSHAARTRHIMR